MFRAHRAVRWALGRDGNVLEAMRDTAVDAEPRSRRRLGWILAGLFALAMIMGTGPGVELVNDPSGRVFGLPVVYVWGLLWYGVQMGCVLTAYFKVWSRDE